MMVNFVLVLAIMALAAWLGNLLISVEAALGQTRLRVRSAKESVAKLEGTIKRLQKEEEAVLKEIEEIGNDILTVRRKQSETQHKLGEAQARRRPRLLILTDRRNANDKEWLVTVVNPQIMEIDASHPLATEWQRGREYLVWAESDREAHERVNRRFSARPGFSVKSVQPAKDDLYPTPKPAAAMGG